MIDRVGSRIAIRRSEKPKLQGGALETKARKSLLELLGTLTRQHGASADVTIHEHAPQHVGFGTTTALKLGIVAGFREVVGSPTLRDTEQMLSGRGGASGVGVHGFYDGGVLWDAGQRSVDVDHLLPSRACPPAKPPLLMLRLAFPERWRVGLCLPSSPSMSGEDERRFFQLNAPIQAEEARDAMALLHHGVLPGFAAVDLPLLATSLRDLTHTGFKRLEVQRCGPPVEELLADLHRAGHAAGMSSMGPLVYVIVDRNDGPTASAAVAVAASHGAEWLGWYDGLNRGASIARDDAA